MPPGDDPFQSKQSDVGYPFSIETSISINIVDVDDNVPTFYKYFLCLVLDDWYYTRKLKNCKNDNVDVKLLRNNNNIFTVYFHSLCFVHEYFIKYGL